MWHTAFANAESGYARLVGDESGKSEPSSDKTWRFNRAILRIPSASLALAGVVVLAVFTLVLFGTNSTEKPIVHCGASPEEARARGCIYEPMMTSWMPPLCYFPEVAAMQEDIFTTWPWYPDVEQRLPEEDSGVLAQWRGGNYSILWTKGNAHDLHCLYAWKKTIFAIEKRTGWLDSRSIEYHHSIHCAQTIGAVIGGLWVTDSSRPSNATSPYLGQRTAWPMLYHKCLRLD